ncbi:hypothetical protein C0J52_22758 [Blattella germanica]|nr:hypothetical protein C0J52_22758 [Blattella germanica]
MKAQCNGFRKLSNEALVHRLGVSVVSLSFHNPLCGRFYTSRCINMRIILKSCAILSLKIMLHVKQCATILFRLQNIKN